LYFGFNFRRFADSDVILFSTLVDVGMLPFSWKWTKVRKKVFEKESVIIKWHRLFKEGQQWHFEKYQINLFRRH